MISERVSKENSSVLKRSIIIHHGAVLPIDPQKMRERDRNSYQLASKVPRFNRSTKDTKKHGFLAPTSTLNTDKTNFSRHPSTCGFASHSKRYSYLAKTIGGGGDGTNSMGVFIKQSKKMMMMNKLSSTLPVVKSNTHCSAAFGTSLGGKRLRDVVVITKNVPFYSSIFCSEFLYKGPPSCLKSKEL